MHHRPNGFRWTFPPCTVGWVFYCSTSPTTSASWRYCGSISVTRRCGMFEATQVGWRRIVMLRITRIALAALLVPLAAAAQNPAQPTCADVSKDIDKYADQDVSFYGKINSIEIRDGAMVMVFACITAGGE